MSTETRKGKLYEVKNGERTLLEKKPEKKVAKKTAAKKKAE